MRKVQELRARGLTIVFVSHSMADVKAIGDRVLWLRHGETVALGGVDAVVQKYLTAMSDPSARPKPAAEADSIPNIDHRHGNAAAAILGVALLNDCKYGHDISGNVIRLSLLRASTWPDPEADRGHQRADAAEKGIVGGIHRVGQADHVGDALSAVYPRLAERLNLQRCADADIFAHAEGLEAVHIA